MSLLVSSNYPLLFDIPIYKSVLSFVLYGSLLLILTMNQDTAFRQTLQLVAQRIIDVFGRRHGAIHQISKAVIVSAITYYLASVT